MCLKTSCLRQPMAVDLRFITSAMKIITDLERMGDQAVNISERAILLNQDPSLNPISTSLAWLKSAQSMVKDVLDAFVNRTQTGSFGLQRRWCGRWLNDQVVRGTPHLYGCPSKDHSSGRPSDNRFPLSGTNCWPRHEHRRRCHLYGRCGGHQTSCGWEKRRIVISTKLQAPNIKLLGH